MHGHHDYCRNVMATGRKLSCYATLYCLQFIKPSFANANAKAMSFCSSVCPFGRLLNSLLNMLSHSLGGTTWRRAAATTFRITNGHHHHHHYYFLPKVNKLPRDFQKKYENVENGVETTPAARQLKTVVQQATQHYKKLSCRRETARCFVSLNILHVTQGHSRSFKMTLLRMGRV